jgi:hypothetical protein
MLVGSGALAAPREVTQMAVAALWERFKPAVGADLKRALGVWIAQLKKGLAAIAAAKSSQQFGREEEKER